ncbi:hypothetical protein HOA92_01340 [archaeon]|jgi:hypothetical protein|nr:hypothetical protein [archaeon]MBT6761662.1 hypothetical protein [archaeon]
MSPKKKSIKDQVINAFSRSETQLEARIQDTPDERWSIHPYVEQSASGIFYEDPFIKIHIYSEGDNWNLKWTNFNKSGNEVTTAQEKTVNDLYGAFLELQSLVADYWTSGTLHPTIWERVGEAPKAINEIFQEAENQYQCN